MRTQVIVGLWISSINTIIVIVIIADSHNCSLFP
jgi:hypothetical protein